MNQFRSDHSKFKKYTIDDFTIALDMRGIKWKRYHDGVICGCPLHQGIDLNCQASETDNGVYCYCYSHCGGFWADEACPELKEENFDYKDFEVTKVKLQDDRETVKVHHIDKLQELWRNAMPLPPQRVFPEIPNSELERLGWRWVDNDTVYGMGRGVLIPYWTSAYPDEQVIGFAQVRHISGERRFSFAKGLSPTLYGLWNLREITECPEKERVLWVCEGCVRPDAEVLTKHGWVRFDQYNGEEIMISDGTFEKPSKVIKLPFRGNLIEFSNSKNSFYHISTPDHIIPMIDKLDNIKEVKAGDMKSGNYKTIDTVVSPGGDGIPLSDDMIRLLIAIQADGHIRGKAVLFNYSKEYKNDNLLSLCSSLGLNYRHSIVGKKAYKYELYIYSDQIPCLFKKFPWEWISLATPHQREVILHELEKWDGNVVNGRNISEYNTTIHDNAVWVKTLANISGYCSTVCKRKPSRHNHLQRYKTTILWGKNHHSWQTVKKKEIPYEGTVYCVKVSTQKFFIKFGDNITVTGNCHDAVVLDCCQVPVVGVPSASSANLVKQLVSVCRDKSIRLVYAGDNDEAGDKLRAVFDQEKIPYRVKQAPNPYKDWGEFANDKGLEAVSKYVDEECWTRQAHQGTENRNDETDVIQRVLDIIGGGEVLNIRR